MEVVAEAGKAGRSRLAPKSEPLSLTTLTQAAARNPARIVAPMPEIMRVLGGGLVAGSVTLLGGEPGIGKSTLLLQLACNLRLPSAGVIYVAGEESPEQIALRAARLGLSGDNVTMVAETNIDSLLDQLDSIEPGLVLIDSIQTMRGEAAGTAAGSLAQVRECGARLVEWAKRTNVPVIMTGHVTKDGNIAGPRVLEHAVDLVLYIEGDGLGPYRIVRCVKNRFGSADEIALLEMTETGLEEVADPSEALMQDRTTAAGSLVTPVVEGTRPLLVEIQALVTPSLGADARRMSSGLDFNRLLLISAVLSRSMRLPLGRQDIIVNAIGGLRVTSPSADLAIALAIVSSLRDVPVRPDVAAFGEIGLTGDIRRVPQLERRVSEASRRGFRRVIVPASVAREGREENLGVSVVPVATLRDAVTEALEYEAAGTTVAGGRP